MTTTQEEILVALRQHLESRGIEGGSVVPEAKLGADLDLDSLDTMELTLAMEEHYGIEIPDAELEGLATVRDAVDLIQRKLPVTA